MYISVLDVLTYSMRLITDMIFMEKVFIFEELNKSDNSDKYSYGNKDIFFYRLTWYLW